jgi:hypothetical protein
MGARRGKTAHPSLEDQRPPAGEGLGTTLSESSLLNTFFWGIPGCLVPVVPPAGGFCTLLFEVTFVSPIWVSPVKCQLLHEDRQSAATTNPERRVNLMARILEHGDDL